MTTAQLQRLSNLRLRASRYEIAAVLGQRQVLVGYTARHSRHGLLRACRAVGPELLAKLEITPEDLLIPGKNAQEGFRLGPYTIKFTGRTEREAILAGEIQENVWTR